MLTYFFFYCIKKYVIWEFNVFKLFKSLKKIDWIFIVLIGALVVFQVWLELTLPDYTQNLTTLLTKGTITMSDVWYNGGIMLLCAVGSTVGAFVCGFFAAKVGSSLAKSVRTKLFNKIMQFSNKEMSQFSTPSLITRTTNDVINIQFFVAMALQVAIKAPILAIWAISKISVTSFEWTLATLLTVLVIVLVVGILLAITLQKFKKMQKLIDNVNDVTRENVSGVRVVRAFNAESFQEAKFEKANQDLTQTQLFTSRAMGFLFPFMTIMLNGLTLAIYWIGAVLMNNAPIIERALVIGRMTSFSQYAIQVVMSFIMLILIFILLPRAIVSAKRINEVFDTKVIMQNGEKEPNTRVKGKIEFKNVSFKYDKGTENVLSNISFKATKGETIAFIGATGSGKTTVLDLIPRYCDVSSGKVLVDNVDVRDYDQEFLRDKIAYVSQKAILFKGDVKSNITYGAKEEVEDGDERIARALKISGSDFVFEMKEGIHSPVAQNGTNFSGGQKQRLSIARALFKDSEIIIFDDSFSALDYKTDSLIRKNLKENLKDKTILIVAQRIGTIMNADKIIVLDKGKIVAQGKHKELVKSCQLYKEIALSQLSKEEI